MLSSHDFKIINRLSANFATSTKLNVLQR